jgi:hypothetical protein
MSKKALPNYLIHFGPVELPAGTTATVTAKLSQAARPFRIENHGDGKTLFLTRISIADKEIGLQGKPVSVGFFSGIGCDWLRLAAIGGGCRRARAETKLNYQ